MTVTQRPALISAADLIGWTVIARCRKHYGHPCKVIGGAGRSVDLFHADSGDILEAVPVCDVELISVERREA